MTLKNNFNKIPCGSKTPKFVKAKPPRWPGNNKVAPMPPRKSLGNIKPPKPPKVDVKFVNGRPRLSNNEIEKLEMAPKRIFVGAN